MRLISACDFFSRNTRGRALPGCAWAVTVPSSAKPKPIDCQASAARPSLSRPAATPTRPGNRMPATVTGAPRLPASSRVAESASGERLNRDRLAIMVSWIASGSPW